MRLPSGTRIEETARVADEVEAVDSPYRAPEDLGTVLDNLGVAVSGINKSYSNAGTFSSLDGEIQISLNEGHRPTASIRKRCAGSCRNSFPAWNSSSNRPTW
jgi:hypothetical protein